MWDFFLWIYDNLVYRPQLNLLEFFYIITNDIGWAIVLLAIVVNVLLWPLFAKSYINTQKMRLLQPHLREIQDEYKSNPSEMMKQVREFYKKHDIKNGSTFLVLIFQIVFATGLFRLTTALSNGQELVGLYPQFFDSPTANFGKIAFGSLVISQTASEYIWIPLFAALFSYLLGMYMFRWAPKPNFPQPNKKKPKKEEDTKDVPLFDPEAFQKTLELQTIYFFPIVIFFTNYFIPTGVAIYFLTVSILALVRQFLITHYFKNHVDKMIDLMVASDPMYRDDDPSNNLEADLDPSLATSQPVPALIQKTENKNKSKSKITKTKSRTKKKQTRKS